MSEPPVPTSVSPVAKRRWAIILFTAAVAVLAMAVVQLLGALEQPAYTADDFIMPAVLLMFGLILLGAARAARRPSTTLTLPPEGPPTH